MVLELSALGKSPSCCLQEALLVLGKGWGQRLVPGLKGRETENCPYSNVMATSSAAC